MGIDCTSSIGQERAGRSDKALCMRLVNGERHRRLRHPFAGHFSDQQCLGPRHGDIDVATVGTTAGARAFGAEDGRLLACDVPDPNQPVPGRCLGAHGVVQLRP